MLLAVCLRKNYDTNNNIISYILKDLDGNVKTVTSRQLKKAMSDKLIAIDNIRLTKDGRLVDKSSGYYELYSIGYDTETQSIYYS